MCIVPFVKVANLDTPLHQYRAITKRMNIWYGEFKCICLLKLVSCACVFFYCRILNIRNWCNCFIEFCLLHILLHVCIWVFCWRILNIRSRCKFLTLTYILLHVYLCVFTGGYWTLESNVSFFSNVLIIFSIQQN